MAVIPEARFAMRRVLAAACILAVVLSGWAAYRTWPRELSIPTPRPFTPVIEFNAHGTTAYVPGLRLIADLAAFDDELFAYLIFDHVRDLVSRDGRRAWLTYERKGMELRYLVRLDMPTDLMAAIPYLFRLQTMSVVNQVNYVWVTPEVVSHYESQSQTFDRAYNLPARRKLELLPQSELVDYVRRFIRFKAVTDGRIRRGISPVPVPPNPTQAQQLARDIVTVADFFSVPIDFFLGIGAMENNYMNVKGDIGNAVWKRRAHKGDVILKRGPKGVLVLNESSGIWQITRETLRYANRLYGKDKRDYSTLPEHLRPPKELNLNDVPPEVLTTYAGLLFRDLLDRFQGDVATAVGAYNGGPGNPNPRYEAGTRVVAEHARRVMEHAAVLRGRPAAEMRFLRAAH